MDQHQFKVKHPLAKKLIISFSFLALLVAGFVSVSAVYLVIEDKKAYIYQLQSLQAQVISQEFTEHSRIAVENLRNTLSEVPFFPRTALVEKLTLSESAKNQIFNILRNQNINEKIWISHYRCRDTALDNRPCPVADLKLLYERSNEAGSKGKDVPPVATPLVQDTLMQWLQTQSRNTQFYAFATPALADWILVGFMDRTKQAQLGTGSAVVGLFSVASLNALRRMGDIGVATGDERWLFKSKGAGARFTDNQTLHAIFDFAAHSPFLSGTKQYKVQNISFLGAFTKTDLGPIIITQIEWRKAMNAAFTMAEKLTILGLISLCVAILFGFYFSTQLTSPLESLMQVTQQISKGNFKLNPKVRTQDEVGQLSKAVVIMSQKIQELFDESIKKVKLEEELKIAAAVQENLIPERHFSDPYFELYSFYESAQDFGGDWFGYFKIKDSLCFMIADATGHGVSSALITAAARSSVGVITQLAESAETAVLFSDPEKMIRVLDQSIREAGRGKVLMTFFLGILDPVQQKLTYVNAGHNPPWIMTPAPSTGGEVQMSSLMPTCARLGDTDLLSPIQVGQLKKEVPLQKGTKILFYTDGLLENRNAEGEPFGKKRARQIFLQGVDASPTEAAMAIAGQLKQYLGSTGFEDDVTFAVVQLI